MRQQECGHGAVGLGDDPERVAAEAPAWLALVNRIGGQDAIACRERFVVRRGVFAADIPPIAVAMALKATS